MRKVLIPHGAQPPQDWIDKANAVTSQLRSTTTSDERKTIIKENEGLWRDNRLRNWLLQLFNNKCWYTEAFESVSPIHVDHYRPKGKATELDGSETEAYWWLAFEWKNYRISGHLINSKKSDLFPIVEGSRANPDDLLSIKLEAPLLIDPLTDQAWLISYEKDEDGCVAVPAAGIDEAEEQRAVKTIVILGLNRIDKLNTKRAGVWDDCMQVLADYKGASREPQVFKIIYQAKAITQLRKMVEYNEEFSSIAEACIRKMASEPVRAQIAGQSS
jgi:hypothetical protein